MKRLLLVRHPETQANVESRYLGRADGPYSVRGEKQAISLAEGLAGWAPDVIFSSPARRAFAPAWTASRIASCPLVVRVGLSEFDVGLAEGLTHEQATAHGVVDDSLMLIPEAVPFSGGETTTGFLARCKDVLEDVVRSEEERVALVSHQGPIRAILLDLLDLPIEAMWRFAIGPANAVRVSLSDEFAVLESIMPLRPDHQDGTMLRSP